VNWGDPGLPIQGSDTAVMVHGGLNDITGVVGMAQDGEGGAFISFVWGPWGSWAVNRYDANGIVRSSSGPVADRGGTMRMIHGGSSQGKDSVIIAWLDGAGWGPLMIGKFEDPEQQYPGSPDEISSLWGLIQLSPWVQVWGVFGLISDGEGGAIIAWADHRNGTDDIFVQKINADGSLAWTPDGVPVAVQPGGQVRPQLVSDGYGGAIIVWDDWRADPAQIYAQHINTNGEIQWASNGILISSIRGIAPKILRIIEGKYIIVWIDTDANGGTPDYLRTQKLDSAGGLLWPAEGVIIADIYTSEFEIAPDGGNGLIVVWSLGDGDIYAKRIAPVIGYSPQSFIFSATYGAGNPPDQSLSITNKGAAPLQWSTESDALWLSLTPAIGTGSGTVTVSIESSGLLPGTYHATISLTGTDASNSPISIPVTLSINPPPRMMLRAPNGGEAVAAGSSYPVTWIAAVGAEMFDLKYSCDNGLSWQPIKDGNDLTGTGFNWQVPLFVENKKQCLVKVIGYDSSGTKVNADRSDGPFTVEVVKVTAPSTGVTLVSGNSYSVKWTTNATKREVANVRLYYTKNGGASWSPICDTITGKCSLAGNPGVFGWQVPNVLGIKSNCKIKVVLRDAGGKSLGSDTNDPFTIQPGIP
jgi:hypothetical protein